MQGFVPVESLQAGILIVGMSLGLARGQIKVRHVHLAVQGRLGGHGRPGNVASRRLPTSGNPHRRIEESRVFSRRDALPIREGFQSLLFS